MTSLAGRLFASLLVLTPVSVSAQAAADPAILIPAQQEIAVFAPEIEAFQRQDSELGIGNGGVLFVGSSSIRLWDVATAFPNMVPVNRGFGGSAAPNVLYFYPQLLANRRPDAVVVYIGENDIARGDPPEQVASNVMALLNRLRADLPRARIVCLSLKPGPARWRMWPRMQAVNAAIRARADTVGDIDFLDVATPLIGPDGLPDASYFIGDHIHLNARGYALWTAIVGAYLEYKAPVIDQIGGAERVAR